MTWKVAMATSEFGLVTPRPGRKNDIYGKSGPMPRHLLGKHARRIDKVQPESPYAPAQSELVLV